MTEPIRPTTEAPLSGGAGAAASSGAVLGVSGSSRWLRRAAWAFGLLVLVCLGLAWGLTQWLDSADFRARVQTQASAAVGVPVKLEGLSVRLWPQPAVAVSQLGVATRPEIRVNELQVRPDWWALLRGEAAIRSLLVRDARLPQEALAALAALSQARAKARAKDAQSSAQESDSANLARWLPRTTELERVSLVAAKGEAMTLNARLVLDEAAWPERLDAQVLAGRLQGARLSLRPQDDAGATRAWALSLAVGGGTVAGPVRLLAPAAARRDARPDGPPAGPTAASGVQSAAQQAADKPELWRLSGELRTQGVEVSALTAPSRPLSGTLEADTRLSSAVRNPAELLAVLSTQTRFTVRDAKLNGIDLVKAVKTVGLNRGGQTPLDTLSGQVITRGQAVQLNQLVAISGALSATGAVAISPARQLSGRINVSLAAGTLGSTAVGVPLEVGGHLDDPQVTLTRAALIGAAIGTAVMPGVGTGAGAGVGGQLGERLKGLFGK